jgi:hypothetical protein
MTDPNTLADPIIEAMAKAICESDRGDDHRWLQYIPDAKAAYLAALPMIVEQCAQVAESAYMTDDYDVTAQRIRAHAAAKVEELSRGQ